MGEWKEYKLEEVIEKFIDYRGKTPTKTMFGIPLITAKIVKDGRLLEYNEYIADSDYDNWMTRGFPQINDLVLTTEAPLGQVALIKDTKVALAQRIITLQTKKDICDSIFLKYYFQSNEGQGSLQSRSSGSTVEGIKAAELRKVEIFLPPLLEQRAITSVLSSLDDKIDLLHRQNATLEKMAETLFRQWFVEEAKEEWTIENILYFANHYKTTIQPQQNPSTIFFHYSIPSFDNNKNPVIELGVSIQSNKYVIPKNCILFSKLNPHKDKRIWLLQNEVEENSICSTEFQIVLPKKKEYLFFLYGWLSLKENYSEIASGVGGTSGSHQRIDPASIFDFQCPIPNINYILQYNELVSPMYHKIKTNQTQIHTLTQLRDTLLPKLMSGEVRVEM